MIEKLYSNLFIGDIETCRRTNHSDAILHAAKNPCFTRIMGGKVDRSSPHYLYFETEKDLYLNIVDAEEPLFYKKTFDVSLAFIEKHIKERKVILHCNEGKSRSASIAMLYLFRHLDYRAAQNQMLDIYNDYSPSMGIDEWLGYNWDQFKR